MKEFLEYLGYALTITVLSILFLVLIIVSIVGLGFALNKSNCEVFVNNKTVYEGPAKYVEVSSIGENGNTKVVSLHKGFLGFITYKQYVSNSVEVK